LRLAQTHFHNSKIMHSPFLSHFNSL